MLPKGKASLSYPTGEVTEVKVVESRKWSGHRNFFMGFDAGLKELVTENELSGMDMRLLILMLTLMNWDNVVEYTQQALADELKTSPVVISRSIARLKKLDVIKEAKQIGRVRFYRINPYLGSKAAKTPHNKLMQIWNEE